MAAKKVMLRCPGCDELVTLDTGFWHNIGKQKCPKCREGISLKRKGMEAMSCPGCGNSVMYDARKDNVKCPVCSKPLRSGGVQEVICPKCGIVNRVPVGQTEVTCMICETAFSVEAQQAREEASESDRAYVIKGPEDPSVILWKHPLDAFPYRSRLIVNEGMWALCLQNGECRYPVGPGSYPLNESPLKGEQKFDAAVSGEETVFSTQVYFVRRRIDHNFPWGTPAPLRVRCRDGEAQMIMSGRVSVNVSDPKAFAELVGYGSHSLDALTRTMGDGPDAKESPLVTLLRQSVCDAVGRAAPALAEANEWKVSALSVHAAEIAQEARSILDMELDVRGLKVDQLVIQNLRCEETAESKANREKNEAQRKGREALLRQAERWLNWTAGPVSVHMKDNASLSAEVTLGGGISLRLADPERLLSRPAAKQWLDEGAPEGTVERYFTDMINQLAMNALFDLLQPMIDETNADVRELTRYYGYLRASMTDLLNQALFDWGLTVENFSMQQRRLEKSPALSKLTQLSGFKSESLIEKEMQAFTRSLELDNAEADSGHRVQMRTVESQERAAMTDLDVTDAQTADRAADIAADLAVKKLARDERLRRYQQDIQDSAEDDADARRQQKALRGLDNAAELDARKRQIGADVRRSGFDESYADWQRQTRLEEEKLASQLRIQQMRQDAAIQTSRRDASARREDEREDLEHRRMLGEITRKIDQSDLDWEQKLDAYARLKLNADADDRESRKVSGARAEADAEYIRSHLKTVLSREESDFLEEQAQRAEDREERRRQRQYAREMEARRESVAWQMELLRMEHEQQDKAEAAQQRIRDQQMEIDKLKLTLGHYERVADRQADAERSGRAADRQYELDKLTLTLDHDEAMGRQRVDTVDILAGAEAVRTQVEKEYAERFARRDQEAEEKRRAEKARREDQYADRAEALLRQMWDIQKSLKGLELENDREYIRGRAQVDTAAASRRDSDLEQLIQEVQKLAGKVEKVRTRQKEQDRQNEQTRKLAEVELLKSLLSKSAGKEPAKVKYTVDPTIPVEPTPSFTAGGSTLKCPHCGHPVYKQTVICPYCNKPVQG